MSVRAKFQVVSITQHYANGSSRTIRMEPRYDTSIPEDRRFYDATPWGLLEMTVNNPAALDQLKNGQTFYLDLTPVNAE